MVVSKLSCLCLGYNAFKLGNIYIFALKEFRN